IENYSGQEVSMQLLVNSEEDNPVTVLDSDSQKAMNYDTHDEYAVDTLLGSQNFEVSWIPIADKYFLFVY
ncbi:hypothetical protein PMAYCL1PPCAC_21776, partial [Pristionchus mayeri]